MIIVFIVVKLLAVMMLVFGDNFCNLSVYLVVHLFIVLAVRRLLLFVTVHIVDVLSLLCLMVCALSLAGVNLFSRRNRILDVQ